MTAGLADTLVLGLGNLLLEDDAAGLKLLERVAEDYPGDDVEFVDGGTQGLGLLRYFSHRRRIVILDAVGLGHPPGTVHILRGPQIQRLRAHRATTAHEGNALELLAVARLLGDEPEDLVIVGIEPERLRTGIGLSRPVSDALPHAAALALETIGSYVPCHSG